MAGVGVTKVDSVSPMGCAVSVEVLLGPLCARVSADAPRETCEGYRVTDYFPHTTEDGMLENENEAISITQDDIAGLIAVAQFIQELDIEGDVPEKLRELAAKLSRFVVA